MEDLIEVPRKCCAWRGVNRAGTIVSSPDSIQPTPVDACDVPGSVAGAGVVTDG